MAVARCCSLFNVINKALNEGLTMEGLKDCEFAPMVVSFGSDVRSQSDETKGQQSLPTDRIKSQKIHWWEFWK